MKPIIIAVLLLFSCCQGVFVFSQSKPITFNKITITEGLSQSLVNTIFKDKEGFMWFGTTGGLNRYDGYEFKVYETSISGKNKISGNFVSCIHETEDGTLWVGTIGGGINKFDRKNETFEVVQVPSKEDGVLRILTVYEDPKGNLYFGTDESGIIFIEKKTSKVKLFKSNIIGNADLQSNTIRDFLFYEGRLLAATLKGIQEVDSEGNFKSASIKYEGKLPETTTFFKDKTGAVWVGWEKGLGKLKKRGELYEIENPIQLPEGVKVQDIAEDNRQNLWVATFGSGLLIINKERDKWSFYKKNFLDPSTINNNEVNRIYKDNTGIMWMATNGGVNKYDESVHKFNSYQTEFSDNLEGILEDQKGRVWFSTLSKGVSWFNPSTREFKNFKNPGVNLDFICEDQNGGIWSVTPYKALNKFSESAQNFQTKFHLPAGYTMISATDGKLYLPTFREGLKVIDPETEEIESVQYSPNLKNIYSLYEGKNTIWIGSQFGVVGELNKATRKITDFTLTFDGKTIDRRVMCILQDSKGNLWFGTSGLGLYLFDIRTRQCIAAYSKKDGIPNDEIMGILEDDSGKLWVSTKKGLASINHDIKEVKTYFTLDGLVHDEFNYNIYHKGKKGVLYFGGIEGFNYFNPQEIEENEVIPPVYITDFQVFNKSVPLKQTGDSSELFLESIIEKTKEVELDYDQNVFSFEFAALNYSLTDKNKYLYKMEGFDREWIPAGKDRTAVYTNLDPGNYTFKVKASNNDGVWNEQGTSIQVKINPPFWRTWWAYSIYPFILALLLYSKWRHFTNRQKLQNEVTIRKLESQKLQEVDEIKTRFYTNVSHEFRTPLTLILGPLEAATSLSVKLGEKEIQKNLEIVNRNAQRLLDLINQLMDFSKLESGNMKLNLEELDIIKFLRTCTLAFSSLAVSKGIELQYITTAEQIITSFDKDKLEKILNNLLSNALKFTREGGSVEVLVDFNEHELLIHVIDNGIGIPEDKVADIFNRYYQVDNTSKTFEGTGIGLALLKELVALHRGKIKVKSNEGKGTVFTVQLPIEIKELHKTTNSHKMTYAENSVVKKGFRNGEETVLMLDNHNIVQPPAENGEKKDKPIVLIVEDNEEIRAYIKTAFGKEFIILESENGKKGLLEAEKRIPDLVITDIMMPEMDGQELCRLLKTNEKTSHIPVILLTAKAGHESKLEGFETGADDYITKPFHLKELQVRVKNLIDQREKLRKRFTREVTLQPKEIAITSADENFLNRCISIIEKHMSDPDFSVDAFGKEVGMSRSQLHRKLKALIDQSTSEFIRNIRLKRAAELVKNKFGNTAEVSYEVGFNSVSYFIKCFKEVYGKTPTEMGCN